MIHEIDSCVEHFYTDILKIKFTKSSLAPQNYFCASIPLTCNGVEQIFYLFFERKAIEEIGHRYFGEEILSLPNLDDLLKEVANLIIGSAKVKLGDKNPQDNYQLGTPEFLGEVDGIDLVHPDSFISYKSEDGNIFIIAEGKCE